MSGEERAVLRSYAAEQVLEYLCVMEKALSEHELFRRVNAARAKAGGRTASPPPVTLDTLRLPLSVVPFRKPANDDQALKEENAGRSLDSRQGEDDKQADGERLYADGPSDRQGDQEETVRPEPLDAVEPLLKLAILLGDPGSGKSEYLKYLARRTGVMARDALLSAEMLPSEACLPVFVHLREVADALVAPDGTKKLLISMGVDRSGGDTEDVAGAILYAIGRRYYRQDYPVRAFRILWNKLKAQNPGGRSRAPAVICLDGWDELTPNQRNRLLEPLRVFTGLTACRLFLASRIVGYADNPLFEPPPPDRKHDQNRPEPNRELEICRFEPHETAGFIESFFENEDEAIGRQLIDELKEKHSIADMARNALLTTLLCMAYQPGPDESEPLPLPVRRVELYDRILVRLLRDWNDDEAKPVRNTGRRADLTQEDALRVPARAEVVDDKLDLLQAIARWSWPSDSFPETALKDFVDREAEIPRRLYLREVVTGGVINELREDGIFASAGVGSVRFLHRTMHEYLVARSMAKLANGRRGYEAIADDVNRKSWDPYWENVMIMLAGLLDNPGPMLERLSNDNLDDRPENRNDIFHHRTILAALCLAEIKDEIRNRPSIQDRIAEVTKIIVNGAMDDITQSEVQANAIPSHYRRALPAIATVNGNLEERPVLDWIAEGIAQRQVQRIIFAGACGPPAASSKVLNEIIYCLCDSDTAVRWVAGFAVRSLDAIARNDEFTDALTSLITSKNRYLLDSLMYAVNGINSVGGTQGKFLTALAVLLTDEEESVRGNAAGALAQIGVPLVAYDSVMTTLADLIRDSRWEIRQSVVHIISKIGPTAAGHHRFMSKIAALLRHEKETIRSHAAKIVDAIGPPAACFPCILNGLARMLTAEKGTAHHFAMQAARKMGAAAAGHRSFVSVIADLLTHENHRTRSNAADIAGYIGRDLAHNTEILELLGALVSDDDKHVQISAVRAIGKIGLSTVEMEKTILEVASLLRSDDGDIRSSSVIAIEDIGEFAGTKKFLYLISKLLINTRGDALQDVTFAIRAIGPASATPEILSAICEILIDPERSTYAANCLSRMGANAETPEILEVIARTHCSPEKRVRQAGVKAASMVGPAAVTEDFLSVVAEMLQETDEQTRRNGYWAVERVGPYAATDKFLNILSKLLTSPRHGVVEAALHSVKAIGPKAATDNVISKIPHLLRQDYSTLPLLACSAVTTMGVAACTPKVLSCLAALLGHPDGFNRRSAINTISRIGSFAAKDPLIMEALFRMDKRFKKEVLFNISFRWAFIRIFYRQPIESWVGYTIGELTTE